MTQEWGKRTKAADLAHGCLEKLRTPTEKHRNLRIAMVDNRKGIKRLREVNMLEWIYY